MGSAMVNLKSCTWDELGRQLSRICNRHNLVVITMQNERRYIKLLQIRGEVSL